MTSATITTDTALLQGPDAARAPQSSQIVRAAKAHGVSPLRQMREMLMLQLSPAKLQWSEYFANGLYDPSIGMAQKREYVGVASNRALNGRMSPLELVRCNDFVNNKVLYTALLNQVGLNSTRTQAVVLSQRRFGGVPTLANAAGLRAFLENEARYPLFGKPNNGSLSVGSVSIRSIDRDAGKLHLANGQSVDLERFCDDVVGRYPTGYILQDALEQHGDLQAIAGKAIGTVRIVTVIEQDAPRPLYAVWKIPSPRAMSDNFWQAGSMIAALDVDTGQVGRVRIGSGLDGTDIAVHPVSNLPFDGFRMPDWDAARQLACDAHLMFPEFGIVGFDMAITADGPAIVECNDNPFHMLYQLANQRGIRNQEFAPVFDRVAARAAAILARRSAAAKKKPKSAR